MDMAVLQTHRDKYLSTRKHSFLTLYVIITVLTNDKKYFEWHGCMLAT